MIPSAHEQASNDIVFVLNGVEVRARVDIAATAFELLRHEFGLASVRSACDGIGMCGTCTILVDGRASPSCLMLAIDLADTRVLTVEGLANGGNLHPLQLAFMNKGALQCGFCTAGMILAAYALLDECPNPSRNEIARGLAGNLCRCTGYAKIIEAVASVAEGSRG
jgi:aerobic carbon-monoxide dehydrogenase small subunit